LETYNGTGKGGSGRTYARRHLKREKKRRRPRIENDREVSRLLVRDAIMLSMRRRGGPF